MRNVFARLCVVLVIMVSGFGAKAEEPGRWAERNGWEIVAGFQKSVERRKVLSDYWSLNAGAGYRLFFFNGFNFNPQARFVYRKLHFDWSGRIDDYVWWDVMLSLRPSLGYKWKALELYTGPTLDARLFHAEQNFGVHPYPVVMAWQFGVGADLTRGFALRFDFNLPMTTYDKVYHQTGKKYIEASVAYRL